MEFNIEDTIKEEKTKEEKLHDRLCPHCHQPVKTKVGLGNWKSLFRKPSMDEWITLFILIMLILAAFAYNNDTKACRETLSHLDIVCLNYNKFNNTTKNPAALDNPLIWNLNSSSINKTYAST